MENLEEKKKVYESPFTKKTQVELEDGVCVSSGEKQKSVELDTDSHISGGAIDVQDNTWDGIN